MLCILTDQVLYSAVSLLQSKVTCEQTVSPQRRPERENTIIQVNTRPQNPTPHELAETFACLLSRKIKPSGYAIWRLPLDVKLVHRSGRCGVHSTAVGC